MAETDTKDSQAFNWLTGSEHLSTALDPTLQASLILKLNVSYFLNKYLTDEICMDELDFFAWTKSNQ